MCWIHICFRKSLHVNFLRTCKKNLRYLDSVHESMLIRLSKCVVSYQYDTTHVSCKWHDTTRHQKAQNYKKSGVAETRTHDRGSVMLWRRLLYNCATGLTPRKLVKIKIIYHIGGILCCMVLCRVALIGQSNVDFQPFSNWPELYVAHKISLATKL